MLFWKESWGDNMAMTFLLYPDYFFPALQVEKGAQVLIVPELVDYIISSLDKVVISSLLE